MQENAEEKNDALPAKLEPFHLDRKARIKEMREMYAIRERKEARKARVKMAMLTRPSEHLQHDKEFLEMLYADFMKKDDKKEMKIRRAAREAKAAITYLDTRNRFWKQQTPHHIRERSTVMKKSGKDPSKTGPPPTQAMYKFVIKEMMRINGMLEKSQFRRTVDNAKKLIDHLNNLETGIPNQFNILANLLSIIGQAYLELGDYKKSLAFHMKDLQMATEHDLEEAKSRALDNTGRVFARTGEFAKAIAVWEEKLESPFPLSLGEKAWLCHELGYCYIEIEDFKKARSCGKKSLKAADESKDKQWQLNANILIAQANLNAGEAALSKAAFERALIIATELGDEKAKDSIIQAVEELDKVLALWKEEGRDINTKDEESKPSSAAASQESSKTIRSQADWFLEDGDTENHEKQNKKAIVESSSESDTAFVRKRKTQVEQSKATYIGGQDSDFYITQSGESDAQAESSNESHKKTDRRNSELTQSGQSRSTHFSSKNHDRENKMNDAIGMKREISFTNSVKQSPQRTTKPENSLASTHRKGSLSDRNSGNEKSGQSESESDFWDVKVRREVSFSRNAKKYTGPTLKREGSFASRHSRGSLSERQQSSGPMANLPKSGSLSTRGASKIENKLTKTDMPLSPSEKKIRTNSVYNHSMHRELSNASMKRSLKKESSLSSQKSKQRSSMNDLTDAVSSAGTNKRRNSVSVGLGQTS